MPFLSFTSLTVADEGPFGEAEASSSPQWNRLVAFHVSRQLACMADRGRTRIEPQCLDSTYLTWI